MGLETGTYINSLVPANPVGATDLKREGDDHIRLLKSTIQASFPSITGAVTAGQAEINSLTGRQPFINTFLQAATEAAARAAILAESFPAGTKMLFQNDTAPTGWTKVTDHTNKALRLVDGDLTLGSGGATVFDTLFGSGKATASYALTDANLPVTSIRNPASVQSVAGADSVPTNVAGNVNTTFGSGTGHTHDLSLNLAYVDVVMCVKG